MKGKITRLSIASIIAMLLTSMIITIAANPYPPPPDMYIVPETSSFNTATTAVTFKWNETVWLNMDVSIFSWQVRVTFDSTWLQCNKAGYAGVLGADSPKSEYFTGHTTTPVSPVIAAGYVQHGEALSGSDSAAAADKRLFWFEMEIIAAPDKYETLTSALHFDIETSPKKTFVLSPDLIELPFVPHDGSVSYVWSAPALPHMGFNPTSFMSDRYDPLPTNFTKEVYVESLDAAWHLSEANFKVNYNVATTYPGLLAVLSITPNPFWGSVVVDTSVANVITINASLPSTNPFGNVLVATILFDITYKDTFPGVDTCQVTFSEIHLKDTTAEIGTTAADVESDTVEGLLTLPLPYLAVSPNMTMLGPEPVVGSTFDINVELRNLDWHWYLIAAQFRLSYDPAFVEPVAVVEGDFLPSYAALQPGSMGTFFVSFFPETIPFTHVLVGDMILPNATGWWNPPFPEGDGIIATITFEVLKQIYPINTTLEFNLYPVLTTWFVDQDGNDIPSDTPLNGTAIITGSPLPGRVIDLFTQYPAPYGGQGQDNPSDMFWPQKEIILNALVTYNYWPMQQKLVGFELKDPQGNTWAKLSAVTNADGFASVSIRLPWPCDDPELLFGVWHAIATVDVACIVINDTLDFHYDYLARIFKVTITPPICENDLNFAHCDDVNITVEYGSYAIQTYPAVIAFVLSDEVNVPVAIDIVSLEIGGAQYCSYKKGTVTLTVHIPKFAVAGVATLHVNIFDADPFDGGIPLSPEITPAPTIFITPY